MTCQAVQAARVQPSAAQRQDAVQKADAAGPKMKGQPELSFEPEPSGQSYRLTVKLQKSAAEGEKSFRVDRQAAEALMNALKSGGRVSGDEAQSQVLPTITDRGYAEAEKPIARTLLAAVDGRKSVKINGDDVNLTGPAKEAVKSVLARFWGSLGGKQAAANRAAQSNSGPGFQQSSNFQSTPRPNPYV